MVWRFQAINVFLTYPQCNIPKERVLELLKAIRPIKDYCIAEELHQDGTPHIHAWVCFVTKVNTQVVTFFDLIEGERTYHPNIQKPRSIKHVQEYITKDENYISSPKYKDLAEKKPWSEMGSDCTTVAEFMEQVKEHHPKEFWLHHRQLLDAAEYYFKARNNVHEPIAPPTPMLPTAEMTNWLETEYIKVYFKIIIININLARQTKDIMSGGTIKTGQNGLGKVTGTTHAYA